METTVTFCGICKAESARLFKTKVLNTFDVQYYRCPQCGFIQTESPYWLNKAYEDAIAVLDIGLASRNINSAKTVERVIRENFSCAGKFLDYGGGHGLLVRLMRDRGFDFWRQDSYCENIFARFFDSADLAGNPAFELVTAIEVFEHLVSPPDELSAILHHADSVLFTTELQPQSPIKSVDDWWYFLPQTGQHVSFYTKKSLEELGKSQGCALYSNNSGLHLLTRRKYRFDPMEPFRKKSRFRRMLQFLFPAGRNVAAGTVKLKSLLPGDFERVQSNLRNI
jgi:hypothetical protein